MIGYVSAEQLEELAKKAYDRLAKNYYSVLHPTSRVFDYLISNFIRENPLLIEPNEIYLEVGCGRSRLVNACKSKTTNIILIDISQKMLLHSRDFIDQMNIHGNIASALHIPICNNIIAGVYSFLGDPFNTVRYFEEVYRVLKLNGRFLHIIPNYLWASTLRNKIGIPINKTIFFDKGKKIVAPSLVLSNKYLEKILDILGFSEIIIKDLFLSHHYPKYKLSNHIKIAMKELNMEIYKIPLLTSISTIK